MKIAGYAALAATLCLASITHAQIVSNFVGGGSIDGLDAINAPLANPVSLDVDAAGNLYIGDAGAQRVIRVDAADQKVRLVAGKADGASTLPAPAINFALGSVSAVAVDGSGNVYVGGSSILRVDAGTSTIDAVYNNVLPGISPSALTAGDGTVYWSTAAQIYATDVATGNTTQVGPRGAWIPSEIRLAAGNVYIASTGRIYKYSLSGGAWGPIAGTENAAPKGIAVDASGNVFFVDSLNALVRRIDAATGNVDTVVGGGTGGDGPALATKLESPKGLAIFGSRLYVAEGVGRVRKVEGGVISAFAGGGAPHRSSIELQDSTGHPFTFDAAGNLYVFNAWRVWRIDATTGLSTAIAGIGTNNCPCLDGVAATQSGVAVSGIAVDAAGNVFLSDGFLRTVRRIDASTGLITRYAGTGTFDFPVPPDGDGGPATGAHLGVPGDLAFDPAGNLHVSAGSRIRRVDKTTGVISTVAGAGTNYTPADGTPASDFGFGTAGGFPLSLAIDAAGNVHFGDNVKVYRVDAATGLLHAVGQNIGYSSLAIDGGGNVFFSDRYALQVKRIAAADGRVTTVVGTGADASTAGDGGTFGTTANLHSAGALAFGPGGLLYFGDGSRIRTLSLEGISAWPSTASFPARLPQTTSLPIPVTLTNLGPATATVNSITVPAHFALAHDCGASLASGASCTANVTYTPTAVESVSGTLDVTASPSVVQDVPLGGAGEVSLVTHYYESILRRHADPSGFVFWSGERARMAGLGASVNETWFAMSSFFLKSSEYTAFNRNDTDFTTDLYTTFFDRAPDASGLQFWLDQLANGMPREVVLASFQHSDEFKTFTTGIFGSVAARAEVNMVMDFYRGLLGRLPDNSGFNGFVAQMRSAQCQGATQVAAAATQIADTFANSSEYASRNRTNAQYVGDLYNAILRRGGDLASVKGWITTLDTQTRASVRAAFLASAEFQGRVNAVVAQGCLP